MQGPTFTFPCPPALPCSPGPPAPRRVSAAPALNGHETTAGTLPRSERKTWRHSWNSRPGYARGSRAPGQLGLHRDGQVGLVQPAPGVGGAVPALQGDRADVLAL